MRILIAEDDRTLADALRNSLRRSGYAVDWVNSGSEADAALETNEFDLLILDISLPKLCGFEVLKRLRGRNSRLPVLVLTALDSVSDRVRGLDAGADDYLAKPFQLAELEARVRALTRRGMSGAPALIRHGQLSFDQVGRVAELAGERLELSARELSLLETFLQRPGRLVHGPTM
jgi:two-component system, OmpR family, response regulator